MCRPAVAAFTSGGEARGSTRSAAFLGVKAEGRSLESIAQPLTAEDDPTDGRDDDRTHQPA